MVIEACTAATSSSVMLTIPCGSRAQTSATRQPAQHRVAEQPPVRSRGVLDRAHRAPGRLCAQAITRPALTGCPPSPRPRAGADVARPHPVRRTRAGAQPDALSAAVPVGMPTVKQPGGRAGAGAMALGRDQQSRVSAAGTGAQRDAATSAASLSVGEITSLATARSGQEELTSKNVD